MVYFHDLYEIKKLIEEEIEEDNDPDYQQYIIIIKNEANKNNQ